MIKEELLSIFPERLQRVLLWAVPDWENLQEIRLRCGKSIVLIQGRKKVEPEQGGKVVSQREFREVLEYISRYSLYAFEEEIKKGYLTIPGGHRIGVAGKVIMEGNTVKTMRSISFLNVRVCHERRGCSDNVLPYLFEKGRFLSTLIVSPPGAGKTTLLRDFVRNLADGSRYAQAMTVAVIDERSEIAGCYQGIPGKDVGQHCDVLDACGKAEGIPMMLRSMAPEIIAVDEIGEDRDFDALSMALTSGCGLLATVHGSSLRHLYEKNAVARILSSGMFERIILLGKDLSNWIQAIYDGRGEVVDP